MEILNNKIVEISKRLGFELIGFCKIEYFCELEEILNKQQNLGHKTPFQLGKIDDKVFKSSIYNSAIVVGLTYNKIEPNLKTDEVYLSSCAWGKDYHEVIKEKLIEIEKHLKESGYLSYTSVDNSYLDERYLAYKSGLGFYGKNGLLINEKYGSFFFIGVVLTDAIFEYSKTNVNKCYECDKCIQNCPTKALNESGILNGNKCLSYINQKKELAEQDKSFVNKCVYGCDICSNVCPYNNKIEKSKNFKSEGTEIFTSKEFLNMSKEEYLKKYKNNSSYWRGKNIIDRNIKIYLENNLKK